MYIPRESASPGGRRGRAKWHTTTEGTSQSAGGPSGEPPGVTSYGGVSVAAPASSSLCTRGKGGWRPSGSSGGLFSTRPSFGSWCQPGRAAAEQTRGGAAVRAGGPAAGAGAAAAGTRRRAGERPGAAAGRVVPGGLRGGGGAGGGRGGGAGRGRRDTTGAGGVGGSVAAPVRRTGSGGRPGG